MSIRDILIVGAGPSGLATAIAANMLEADEAPREKGPVCQEVASA